MDKKDKIEIENKTMLLTNANLTVGFIFDIFFGIVCTQTQA